MEIYIVTRMGVPIAAFSDKTAAHDYVEQNAGPTPLEVTALVLDGKTEGKTQ